MDYRFVLGTVGLTVLIAIITNRAMDYTNEGFSMDPASKFKALLNYIEFDNDNGRQLLRTKVPLVVENKVRVNNKGGAGGIHLQPRNASAYSRILVGDRGEIGAVGHYSDTGAGTDMPVFGVDKYYGPTLMNVATTERGAKVKVSGTWPHRSYRFKSEYLIDPNLNKFHHSRTRNSPWNDVYLNKGYQIHKISLVNIHAPQRLQRAKFDFYDGSRIVYSTTEDIKGVRDYSLNVPKVMADRVRVTNPNEFLHLANLKIFTKE
jgi:hypothetical protein